jgi:hypothetical protein
MPKVPKLPSALVVLLGWIASVLAATDGSLPSPWREIGAAVLAILSTWLGVVPVTAVIRRHGWAAARTRQQGAGR